MLQAAINNYIVVLSTRRDERDATNTVMAYRNDLKQISSYLDQQGVEQWSQVTRDHIVQFLQAMREDRAYRPTTVARKLAACKSFFRYLLKEEVIASNPVEVLDTPRTPKELPQILTIEQIQRLFQQVPLYTVAGQRDLAMLHILYATGMRASELVSLNIGDFDQAQATVVCPSRNAQARRERVLPLPSVVVETLIQYLTRARPRLARRAEVQALFLNHHGERLTRQGFWLIIKGYARQAQIDEITPHMLRHSFAMLLIQGGMGLRSVQELLGHAHISTVQVYNQMAHSETRRR